MSTSGCLISSSSSVQPRSTPPAPASQSSSMISTTRRRVRGRTLAVHELLVDRGVEPLVVLLRPARPPSRPWSASRSVKNPSSIATLVPMKPTVVDALRRRTPRRPRRRGARSGMSTAASTWSATLWNVVVHSSRKSAPARSTPAGGLGEQLADLLPALLVLEVGDLGEVDGAEHQLRRREPAEPLLHAEVEVAVVDGAALPAHAADESDGLHARQSATAGRPGAAGRSSLGRVRGRDRLRRPGAPCAGRPARAAGSPARRC